MLFPKQSLQCCRNCLPWCLHHSQPTKPFPFPIIQVIQGSIHGTRKQNRYAYTIPTELIPDRPRERLQKSLGRRSRFNMSSPKRRINLTGVVQCKAIIPSSCSSEVRSKVEKRSIPALLTNTSTSNSHEVTC